MHVTVAAPLSACTSWGLDHSIQAVNSWCCQCCQSLHAKDHLTPWALPFWRSIPDFKLLILHSDILVILLSLHLANGRLMTHSPPVSQQMKL